jgi:hypothetical protein
MVLGSFRLLDVFLLEEEQNGLENEFILMKNKPVIAPPKTLGMI